MLQILYVSVCLQVNVTGIFIFHFACDWRVNVTGIFIFHFACDWRVNVTGIFYD